jgi:ribosomal peptide maturation radical SAM protein 1
MPFASLVYPSLALGMFKAALHQRGIRSEVLYLNGDFAERIGVARYYNLVEKSFHAYGNMVGESIFAGAVNEGWSPAEFDAYLAGLIEEGTLHDRMYEGNWRVDILEEAADLRRQVDPFLDDCLERIVCRRPEVVAFSTMISHQLPASLALAKRIKGVLPDATVVFGGADCQEPRGRQILASFPFVDAVVEGEGDLAFPEIVRNVLGGGSIADIVGVHAQGRPMLDVGSARPPDLDEVPIPDYAEYIDMIAKIGPELDGVDERIRPVPFLLVETSRGCWWGPAGFCHFCAEEHGKSHRKKSPERVAAEFTALGARYGWRHFWMTDSAMPPDYPRTLMPLLVERGLDLDISYFIRATVTRNDLRVMRRAGVTRVMPGIETFSGRLLGLINKGTSTLQNLQVLKWCREFGISAEWNLLWAIPGESTQDYQRMLDLFPLLTHLQPPGGFLPVSLMRQSNYHERAAEFGLHDVEPLEGYRLIYGMEGDEARRFATHYTFVGELEPERYLEDLIDATMEWRAPRNESLLYFVDEGAEAWVLDTRPVAIHQIHRLDSLQRCVLLACEQRCGIEAMLRFVRIASAVDHSQASVEKALRDLMARKLVVRDGDHFLALPVDAGEYRGTIRPYVDACLRGGVVSRTLSESVPTVRMDVGEGGVRVDARELRDAVKKRSPLVGAPTPRAAGTRIPRSVHA